MVNKGKIVSVNMGEVAPKCSSETGAHTVGPERQVGRCLYHMSCTTCGVTWETDSSD